MATSLEARMTAERNTEPESTVTLQITQATYRRLKRAAERAGESVDQFIEHYVAAYADEMARDRTLTQSEHETVVPSDVFDELWDALDEPDEPNERLRRAFRELPNVVRWTD